MDLSSSVKVKGIEAKGFLELEHRCSRDVQLQHSLLSNKKNMMKSFVGFIATLFHLFTALVSFDKSKHTFGDFCSRCAGLTSFVVIIYVDVFAI